MNIEPVTIGGVEILPIIEGGKGVGVSNGETAGAFAASGAVGTFSGVNAVRRDDAGKPIYPVYLGKTRSQKHEELIAMAIEGGLQYAKTAYETASGRGRIHMNILWEMGGAQRVLTGILERAKGIIQGITCGAGMPFKLGEICSKHKVFYFPIISSMRAFRLLWLRSYRKYKKFLGGVVYEDPWKAGGHNGLSNSENPNSPQDAYPRVASLRKFMNEVGLEDVPIVMAGGVWHIKDYADWLNNKEIGKIMFQFGTRPILTKESPVSPEWKQELLNIKEGSVALNKFSPTGFYSSAYNNSFIKELYERSERQVEFRPKPDGEFSVMLKYGKDLKSVAYIKTEDEARAKQYLAAGFVKGLKTPSDTLIFVDEEKAQQIKTDQRDCMGCLSHCQFSSWKDHDNFSTGIKADPRSYCIQKTLQDIIFHQDINSNLMFSGHNAFKFGQDSFYKDGFIPTIKQLVDRIMTGN